MNLPNMRSGIVSREFLRIAGGYGVAQEGLSPAGGLDVDNAGNLATDGDVTIKGVISAGSTPQPLTNAAGLIDGDKIQDGTVNTAELADDAVTPAKLADTGDFLVNSMTLGGNIALNGGGNIGTDTDTDLLGIADNALTVNGALIVDTDTLFVDATANEVGINNAAPRTTLEVTGDAADASSSISDSIFAIGDVASGSTSSLLMGVAVTGDRGWIQAVKSGSGTRDLLINPLGKRVGVGTELPQGHLHVGPADVAGPLPSLVLEQRDVDQPIIQFMTTVGAGNGVEAVGAKTLTTTHFIKVRLPGGLTRYIPCGTIA